jgi:hypothetical protein
MTTFNSATEITENTERTQLKTTPIPTFPLRGKESFMRDKKLPLPFRGRDRVGVFFLCELCVLCG